MCHSLVTLSHRTQQLELESVAPEKECKRVAATIAIKELLLFESAKMLSRHFFSLLPRGWMVIINQAQSIVRRAKEIHDNFLRRLVGVFVWPSSSVREHDAKLLGCLCEVVALIV